MKLRILLLILVTLAGFTFSQTQYPLVTIQDIQFVPDSLQSSDPPSPLTGDTVRVRGLVLARPVIDPDTNRGVILSAGARWCTYIQDENNGLWGGLNIIQDDTIGTSQGTFFDLVDTAEVVEFTGRVVEYNTTTELILIHTPSPIPVQIISSQPKRPNPIELTLADLFTPGGGYNFNAEKYEGMYVIFRNVLTSDRVTGTGTSSGNFKINDGLGNSAFIYNQSRYYKSNSSGIISGYQPPLDGSVLSYLRGVVTTRTTGYYIVPIYPGDVGPTTATPPIITSIKRNITLVGPNQPVEISVNAKDLDGFVTEVKLFYSVNGGNVDSLTMIRSLVDTLLYKATIPGVLDSALVDFYIRAKDNQNYISYNPQNIVTGKYFYLVLNRPVKIQDVQYSPFGSGFSGYNSYRVQLTGIVTADTSDIPGFGTTPLRVYMQNDEGPWSGIQIGTLGTLGTSVLNLKKGDNVTVQGVIMESFSVTKIDSLTLLTVNSSNNPVPIAQSLTTVSIGTFGDGVVEKEKWESVLVKYSNVLVDSANADGTGLFGEMFVDDGSGHTRVELQDGNHKYHNAWDPSLINDPNLVQIKKGDRFTELNGVLFFSFSNYKLVPRKDNDFVGYLPNGIEDEINLPTQYSLNQNYPNPFNPATTISYSLPKAGDVNLKIFNVLGQEVKSLVNQFQNVGTYTVTFDASSLPSGVYFYSLNADNFSQVKKMMLLK
jgi:hypothetical protein